MAGEGRFPHRDGDRGSGIAVERSSTDEPVAALFTARSATSCHDSGMHVTTMIVRMVFSRIRIRASASRFASNSSSACPDSAIRVSIWSIASTTGAAQREQPGEVAKQQTATVGNGRGYPTQPRRSPQHREAGRDSCIQAHAPLILPW